MPINQSIAITGSVDQFGRVQPVGGLNEKIEGFFAICQQRGLTGKQGVIIPSANVRHLSLAQELQQAVADEQFFIWAVDDVTEALPILTQLLWTAKDKRYGKPFRNVLRRRHSKRVVIAFRGRYAG
ncbi:putative ATP-dependent protease [Klebsiella michiganensis]|uniref:Putative ATP-dependent protease n=1 Tax=Klebsiella michiganensis TaxID=1134687 RepID=A0A7H4LVZ4_9ENTR|nr:putative ATP-dependent protease [Klebsiella michiganensis]